MELGQLGISKATFSLSNGLRVLVLERPGMPVYTRVAFKAGSRYDPPGKEGLAHFLEHMLVAGTKKLPTKTDLAMFIEPYGGIFGAQTPKEEIFLNVEVGNPDDLDKAFDLLSQMLLESTFAEKSIYSEREAVLGEIGNWEANPARKIWDTRYELYFQGSASGRSGVGTPAGVKASQRSDLTNFHQSLLTADRGCLIISGGVKAETVGRLAKKYFESLPKSTEQFEDGAVPTNREKAEMVTHKENHQIQLTVGFRTCPLGDHDGAALDVLRLILGGGRASSLSRILRLERALVYSIAASSHRMTSGGWWSVETTVDKPKLQPALDAIADEFRRVYEGGISQAELDFAQRKMINSIRMEMQTSGSWVNFHTRHFLHLGSNWDLANYLGEVSQVTLKDLAGVGKKYFAPGSWYLGLIGDVAADEVTVNY